jgi:CBS domain-containing protein
MRVADLVAPYPTAGLDARVVDAARLLAEEKVPGLIVLDDRGRPVTMLAGTQLLPMAVPACCQDDPTLARMIDEAAALRVPIMSCRQCDLRTLYSLINLPSRWRRRTTPATGVCGEDPRGRQSLVERDLCGRWLL